MSGNSMKWSIIGTVAGVIVAAGLVVLYFSWPKKVVEVPDPKPSGNYSAKPIKVPLDPYKIVDAPKGEGDGAPDVQKAIESFYAKYMEIVADTRREDDLPEQIKKLYGDGTMASVGAGTLLPWQCANLLLASAGRGRFNLEPFLRKEDMQYREPRRLDITLTNIAKTALIEGRIAEKKGEMKEAGDIYRAVMVYGVRLAANKARVWIQCEGLEAQERAAGCLASWFKNQNDAGKAKLASEYVAAAARTRTEILRETFGPLCQLVGKWHTGDLILFAKKHPDPAWRAEAALALGMCRFTEDGHPYTMQINRCLDKLASSDSEPSVKQAAEWAKGVTIDVYTEQKRKVYNQTFENE